MLSMCGLLCSVLRGWRHNQAVMLMARALSQTNASLLVQDLSPGPGSGSGQGRGGFSPFCMVEGEKGLSQLLWCDNNKQAVMVSPRQCVDLQRWTLFLSSTTSEPATTPPCPGANGTTGKPEEEGEGTTITVLLEAAYRDRDEEIQPEYHVMVEQLSQPYAWKARDVFGVIVTTTPPQLLAMIQAFFNNALHIDDDFLIKKILTIEVVGKPASLVDPLSIPDCVTPGPWSASQCALTQMEVARSLSPSGAQGLGSGAARTPGNSLRPPALWGLLRHQSSGESATSTSTTLHPQSSTDSERHQSSLDPQSSYDSVSDYPTSDTDDLTCSVTGLYPRGWAVSGAHVVSGQPLSVRAALNQLRYPGQSCSIVTNPLEDLWQEEESRRAADDGCVGRQGVTCLNGPSAVSYEVRSKTLPRTKKVCGHPHSCLPGNMICQGIQPPQPGKREQDMVREAAQYYQRALDAAHVRQEGFKREQSSASDEDFSFSGSRDRVVVTQEPIRYPVRIRSEADLTRATSIIRDNLANIIQNYLFKPGTSPESQPLVSHLALDHPTIKLVGTNEREVGSRISTSGSTESKEGSSPPPLVVAAGGQTPMAPFAPVQKAPLFRSKASPQHPLSKPRSSSPGSTIQMVCLPSPHQKAELTSGMSPCVVKKEKQPFTSSSKVTGKYPARGDKRLTKSEEIVLPPFIRESHIDVPVTAEDDLTSNSSTADLGSTAEYPHPQQATTTSTGHKEKKFDAASKKSVEVDAKYVTATSKESLQIGSPTEESADIIAKNQDIALSSADRSCVTRILETVPPSDIQKADIVPSTERAMVQKMKNGAVVSTPTESISSLQDTVSLPTTSDALINSSQSVASAPKMDTIPDIAMIPPTPDTDTDSAPGTVMTSVTPDTDIIPMTPDKDIAQATQGMNMTEETSKTTKTPATLSNDTVLIMSDIKTPDLIQTYLDVSKEAVATNIVSKVSDADTTITSPTTSDIGRKDEGHSRVVTQAGKDEADDVYCPESVVTIVHDGCISPIVENNLSWEGSSLASESQGESIQRPRCLKDTHKLNTKSSTASESSFESLPYRMLTSQPESLTEDVSNSVSIELTRPPPETERLRAARLELIRQERIHAISLMSTVTTDSEEGQVWAASLEEQPFGSPMIENNNQETWDSPVLDSGVEVALKETCIDHSTKPQHCSPTSPTESAPESGFSSLQETVVEGSARGARSGVCLSKSKDSLDLTDGERCAGTDTFSDDMETLSSSAGEATLMESGPVSQRASPRNSVSDSVHHDSSLAVPTHEVSQHEGKVSKELESISKVPVEEKAFKYLSDDSSEYKMKTSESLSSEDTVVSRRSLDDHIPKLESQGSQEDLLVIQEAKISLSPHTYSRDEADKRIKEARNGYGVLEDKWEPHYTWPPGVSFMSEALHTSIADKLRLLSESEAEAKIRSQSRGQRSKRAMSAAAAGSILGRRTDVQSSSSQGSHQHITKRSSISECKQVKPHSNKKNEELSLTVTCSNIAGQSTTARTYSNAPVFKQCTDAKTLSSDPVPDQFTTMKTHIHAPVPDQSVIVKTHKSGSASSQSDTVQTHNNILITDQSTTLKNCRNSPDSVPSQHTTIKTPCSSSSLDQSVGKTLGFPDLPQSTETVSVSGHSTSLKMHSISSVVLEQSTAVKTCSIPSVPGQSTSKTLRTDSVQPIITKAHDSACMSSPFITTDTGSSVPALHSSTVASTYSIAAVPDQSVIKKTDFSVLGHGQPTVTKSHTSGTSFSIPTVSKTDSSGPAPDQPSIANSKGSHTSTIISTTDACSSTTTTSSKPSRHSSKSGVSDLEDEVFLPPPENYILNGHPIIYCPRVEMADQVRPLSPKTAVSLYSGPEMDQEGIHHSHLPAQRYTPPLTPQSSASNSIVSSVIIPISSSLSSSSSSSVTTGLSSFSSPPDGVTITPGVQLADTTVAAAARVSVVSPESHWSSTPLKQQEKLQQKHVDFVDGMVKDLCQANNLPPTPQSGSPASHHLQQTTATTTITTSYSVSSTTTSITKIAKSTDLKKGRPEKHSRTSYSSRGEKNKELLSGETSPKDAGFLVDGGDGKPRLQRMAHLERTDTSGSPTSSRTPAPPTNPLAQGNKCENSSKARAPPLQHPVKRNGNSELISRNINDTLGRLSSAENVAQDPREGEKTGWNRARETRRGGSEEGPVRSHVLNLRKYGSEELSRATLDSYSSSNSKSYLEPDLSSLGSFQSAGGSLELLEGSMKHCTSNATAQSQELARCEQVSLKSQGSLDKFPHFDQVSASQRQVTPRRKGVSVDDSGAGKSEHMHRSLTLPGSLASPRKEDKKKEKEEKGKRKKKEKEGATGGEKKSAMMSLKGLLRRNKPREKEKEGTQERLSSPSLFRRLERRSKSGSPSPLSDSSIHQPRPGNSPSSSPVDPTSRSPVVANGKTRPVISSPVAVQQPTPITTAPVISANTGAPNRSVAISCSDSESAPSSTPASPQRRVSLARGVGLASQPSPRLYKHVLTRNLSSSQESLDSSILSSVQSSPQSSPHGSPQRCAIPPSASSLSLPAARELSPPAPVMGTRALRGSSNSFSVTIGFRPQIERRRGQRTVSEGADLNRVSLSPGPRRGEGSRVLTQLGKRSSSMEILVCGKIREHCPEAGSSPAGPRIPFSREGSFRLHREISVETLFEVPEGNVVGGSQEDYRRYLDHVHAARHGSCSSLAEEPSSAPEPLSRHHMRKYSVPQAMHLSGMREAAMSNPNLQRSSSPLVRGMSHSSTFSSSPLRRPSSATPAYSPAKRGLCSSTGGSQVGEVGGMPLMRVEEEGPQRKNLDSATDKPPNILVYAANNAEYYEKVKQTLGRCLNPDRYTIYHLTDELAFKSPWSGSTTLLVVCGDVPAHISTVFIRYLLKGGRVLSVCSDFLNMAVPLFAFELPWTSSLVASGTVEVQEQAVVSVSYQRWNSVHLLHHQHCFHSSPRNKRFSRNTEMPSKDPTNRSAVSVEPTHVEIIDEYGGRHRLDLRVLATDDTWGAPTLLSAKVHDGQGTAVFSQVHLEHDPQASLPATSEATNQLAGSNMARLEILQELLATELSLDISSHPSIAYTPAYFLGRHELKEELLNHLQPHMVGERLQRSHTSIEFVKPGNVPKQPAHNLLPILTSACPLTFSTVKYFETLATTSLGRLVIYCEVMSSSMRVVAGNPPLVHGLVVIPTQQTHGQGRGGNVWLSPLGCAMFSIQFHFHLSSPLGQHLSFLQHLVAMSVVQAVVTLPGYNDIPLHLKWPNDIYLGSNLKIGGVVVEATTAGPQVIANVGCGVNLSNSNPTGCINDAIRQYNQEHNTELAEFEREVFLARVFNALEELIHTFQTQGPGAVQHIYYKYWLHSNAVVTVQSEHRHTQSAEVVGVDSYGFLQARLPSGETITLQPDGNSFDMMEGLVYSKVK